VYDVVISVFFSLEAEVIHASKRRIKLIPQLPHDQPATNPATYVKEIHKQLRAIARQISKPRWLPNFTIPTTYVRTLPLTLGYDDSIGWAVSHRQFEYNDVTLTVINYLNETKLKVTIITLGSMEPTHYNSVVRNIVKTVPDDQCILLVLGNTEPTNLTLRGIKVSSEIVVSRKLIVVKELNYLLLRDYVLSAHHHCGCGTMLASLTWKSLIDSKGESSKNIATNIHPHPQGFDQYYNAEWLRRYVCGPISAEVEYIVLSAMLKNYSICLFQTML
jgi:hypothetical protein